MQKLIFVFLAWLLSFTAVCQKFSISGYISDKKTGEKLRNASIFIVNKNAGTTSNNYGFYSLTLSSDSMYMMVSYAGYTTFEKTIVLNMNYKLDIELEVKKT